MNAADATDPHMLAVADALSHPELISQYGKLPALTSNQSAEPGSVSVGKLAEKLQEIIRELTQANPKQLTKRVRWFNRLLGGHIEARVSFYESVTQVDSLIQQAEVLAEEVRATLAAMDATLRESASHTADLWYAIQAGKTYLEQHLDAGREEDPTTGLQPTRERFERRLANLATLRVATEMSVSQLKLARSQAIDLLDRFAEVTTVVVPMWRHNRTATGGGRDDTGTVNEAATAHARLMESLKTTLDAAAGNSHGTTTPKHTA